GDSIAYDQLVERVTGHRPDKTHRFTDWSRRPLTPEQMHYAVSDVTHLRDVFAALDADLKKRARSDWVSEEMEVLTSPKTYDFHPERAWERLKTRVRKPKELAVLMEVAAWREQETPRRRQQGDRHRRRSRPDRRRRPRRRRCAAWLAARTVRRSRDCAETRQAGAGDRKRPRRQGRPDLAGTVAFILRDTSLCDAPQ